MFDFNTSDEEFKKVFTDLHKEWITFADLDGFRLDAAKHVTEDFIAYFSTHIRAHARAVGKDNFLIVGDLPASAEDIRVRVGEMNGGKGDRALQKEIDGLRPVFRGHPSSPIPGMNAYYDFTHSSIAAGVLRNQRAQVDLQNEIAGGSFQNIFKDDHYADRRLNWSFLEMHDWPRFASSTGSLPGRSILGLAYMAFAEGVPVVYYGVEQGFNGVCANGCRSGHSDGLYRQAMFVNGTSRLGSVIPEIDELASASTGKAEAGHASSPQNGWHNDRFLRRDHALYQSARRFFQLRRDCSILRRGRSKFRLVSSESDGVLAFSRIDEEHGREALVVLNTSSRQRSLPKALSLEPTSSAKTWRNILGEQGTARTDETGKVKFESTSIDPLGVMLYLPTTDVHLDGAIGAETCHH